MEIGCEKKLWQKSISSGTKKETTGESVQFPGLDGEALSFVDTNDFLLSSLFLLTDYDKGKRKEEKNGLFQFRKLGQENQPGSFDGFCH